MKCFVCDKEYKEEDIKPLNGIYRIFYRDKKVPLCNTCLRIMVLMYTIENNFDLQLEGAEE